MSAPRWAGPRNAAFAGATGLGLVVLLLQPTSTAGAPGAAVAVDGATTTATVTPRSDGALIVRGPVIATVYGPVQVEIQYRDGIIEQIPTVVYPRASLVDKAINEPAVSTLKAYTLLEQSAQIDTVSGATQTSEGYRGSLQAALDAAHAAPPEEPTEAGHDGHSG